jgi:hypothetical protein
MSVQMAVSSGAAARLAAFSATVTDWLETTLISRSDVFTKGLAGLNYSSSIERSFLGGDGGGWWDVMALLASRVVSSSDVLREHVQCSVVPSFSIIQASAAASLPNGFDQEVILQRNVLATSWPVCAMNYAAVSTAWDLDLLNCAVQGPVALWSTRAPISRRIMAWAFNQPPTVESAYGSLWDCRRDRFVAHISSHDIQLRGDTRVNSMFSAFWDAYRGWSNFRIAVGSRHDCVPDMRRAHIPSEWENRGNICNFTFYKYNCGHIISVGPMFRFNQICIPRPAKMAASWNWLPAFRAGLASLSHSVTLAGVKVVARNIDTGVEQEIGFITEDAMNEGAGEITDVALPDGEYEIEARPASYFWPEARSATFSIYQLRAGEEPEKSLPEVVNLQAEMGRDFWRVLSWSVIVPEDISFSFGVWFGNSADMDISGAPDASVSRLKGLDYYQYYFKQSEPLYAAVAIITSDGVRGKPAILHVPWDAAPLNSPAHQWAESLPKYDLTSFF